MTPAFLVPVVLKAAVPLATAASKANDNRLWDKLEAIFWFMANVVLASLLVCVPFIIIGGLVLLTLTVVVNVGEEMGKAWDRLVALSKRHAPRLMLFACLGLGQTAIALISREAMSADLRVALSFGLWSYAGVLSLISFASRPQTRSLGFKLLLSLVVVPVVILYVRSKLVVGSSVSIAAMDLLAGLGFVDVLLFCLVCTFVVGMFWIALHEPVPDAEKNLDEDVDGDLQAGPEAAKGESASTQTQLDGSDGLAASIEKDSEGEKLEGTKPYGVPGPEGEKREAIEEPAESNSEEKGNG